MNFFRINAVPSRTTALMLSWSLFVAGTALYVWTSHQRHVENPEDRVVPSLGQMVKGMNDAAQKPDEADEQEAGAENAPLWQRFHSSMLWKDTLASGKRFLWGLGLLFPAAIVGMHMALFPYIGTVFLRFILFFDKIVALSVLPILFIAFGIDELSKIMLIVIGVTPTVILDAFNLTKGVPPEQIVKGFTLGAGDFTVAYMVVLRQIWPRVLNSIRLNLKPVALFLFSGEMIASTDGLAYRIALLRRNLSMDVIIPYVLWVALLLFLVDFGMRMLNKRLHPWFREV